MTGLRVERGIDVMKKYRQKMRRQVHRRFGAELLKREVLDFGHTHTHERSTAHSDASTDIYKIGTQRAATHLYTSKD